MSRRPVGTRSSNTVEKDRATEVARNCQTIVFERRLEELSDGTECVAHETENVKVRLPWSSTEECLLGKSLARDAHGFRHYSHPCDT